MERGYFALWRKFQDHPFWKERRVFSKAEAWIDILWEAQHQKTPQDVMIGMQVFKCQYGECLKSMRTWAKRWGWSESRVRRFLELLVKMNQIQKMDEIQTTRITVCNYMHYDPRVTHERRTSDARATTDKNDKNEKNYKYKVKVPIPTDLELTPEFISYASSKGIKNGRLPDLFEAFTIHHRKKGSKFADWYAAWQTWVRNEIKFNPDRYPAQKRAVTRLVRDGRE